MRDIERKELRRRINKKDCTFTRVCGCYVNSDKSIVTTLNETFLNLEDAEFYKYLDIAKAVLKGKLGNNLVETGFKETKGQQFLMDLRSNRLKDKTLLEEFYTQVIENYDCVGNYLILLFHDVYDVVTRTADNEKLDESEDVFEYLLCAICPVNLTKPALGYREEYNTIASRVCDWVVGPPETGFLWPAFTDRKEDRDAVVFFTNDARNPHKELCEKLLETNLFMTFSEHQENLKDIIKEVLGEADYYAKLNEELFDIVVYAPIEDGKEKHAVIDEAEMTALLERVKVPEEQGKRIVRSYAETCRRCGYPKSNELLDERAAKSAQEESAQEWQKNRENRLKEYLRRAYEQLMNPDGQKEDVCSSIAGILKE